MGKTFMLRGAKLLRLFSLAIKKKALREFFDFLLYKTPLASFWKKIQGYDFHQSTIIWFKEGEGVHTRVTLLLPRFLDLFPKGVCVDVDCSLFNEQGTLVKKWGKKNAPLLEPFVIDSRKFQPGFDNPKEYHIPIPFSGSLLIKERLYGAPEKEIFAKIGGIFASAGSYIDYWKEGSFITTLHDYSAFLPDQGLNFAKVGMIPAFAEHSKETFVIMHAASSGIREGDLEVILVNAKGEKQKKILPAFVPYSMRRFRLTELFPAAADFLGGSIGQIRIEGIFRRLLTRVAYGMENKKTGVFSLDHCYYAELKKQGVLSAENRNRMGKGYFNPFLILETDEIATSVMLFQSANDPLKKHLDLLIYDATGKCVVKASPVLHLKGDETERLRMKDFLHRAGISFPFVGHGEVLYHVSPETPLYPRDLDLYLEFEQASTLAHVIFGAKIWNPSYAITKKGDPISYGCRIVCNDTHTTYIGISNCSHAYDYKLKVKFTLNLIVQGKVVAQKKMEIGPEVTYYLPIEELFPQPGELLSAEGGLGLLSYEILNARYLVTVFVTQDRGAKVHSLEHTIRVPVIGKEKQASA